MIQLKDNISGVLECTYRAVVKFEASFCQVCKSLTPVLEEVEKAFPNIDFYTISLDTNYEEANDYGVRTLPKTLLMQNGLVKQTINGFISATDLKNKIAETFEELT